MNNRERQTEILRRMKLCGYWCEITETDKQNHIIACQRKIDHKEKYHRHVMEDRYGHKITVTWI